MSNDVVHLNLKDASQLGTLVGASELNFSAIKFIKFAIEVGFSSTTLKVSRIFWSYSFSATVANARAASSSSFEFSFPSVD